MTNTGKEQPDVVRIAKPVRYRAHRSAYQPRGEYLDFIRRRTEPFLDGLSLANRPIGVLLGEAYMQGLADAVEVLRGGELK